MRISVCPWSSRLRDEETALRLAVIEITVGRLRTGNALPYSHLCGGPTRVFLVATTSAAAAFSLTMHFHTLLYKVQI